MSGRIRVLSPVGEARRHVLTAPALPSDLHGKTVGFLDNTKTNFDRLPPSMRGAARAHAAGGHAPPGLTPPPPSHPRAVSELRALGMGGLPLLVIDHPHGGEKPEG